MEIKEIGGIGVLIVGGAVYGISQYGLNDVLTEDLRHVSTVTMAERPAYMSEVTGQFAEAFETYAVESETYIYVGYSEFKTAPGSGTFVEVVRSEEALPLEEIPGITQAMEESDFCAQEEMTMFTDQGWAYRFTMVDATGRQIFDAHCRPLQPPQPAKLELRGLS